MPQLRGFNLFNALEACSDLLVSFGGHELAAGFTIEERNIPAFRTRMNQYVRAHTGEHPPVSMLDVDVDLQHPSLITLEEVEALSLLEPYGAGNNRPSSACAAQRSRACRAWARTGT